MSFFYIENLGCPKNQVDGENITALLEGRGFTYTADPKQADIIVVNTCGFIEPAKKESIDIFFELHTAYPEKKIVLAGCMAQRYGDELFDGLPEADGVIGNQTIADIVNAFPCILKGERLLIRRAVKDPENLKNVTAVNKLNPLHTENSHLPDDSKQRTDSKYIQRKRFFSFPGSGYLKISEGCDNNCTYCAIPLIRGTLKSRSQAEITGEAANLLKQGLVEINLIGQDLASYGKDLNRQGLSKTPHIIRLVEQLSALKGDFWLRLLYLHPDHFPAVLPNIVKEEEKIVPYFDIPFQHADPHVLKRMGRKGSCEKYIDLIESIRETLPHSVIRSTFLLGFPGETRQAEQKLAYFMDRANLDWAGFFTYSAEEGTKAYSMKGSRQSKGALEKLAGRKAELEMQQQEISRKRMERFVGTEQRVLVEEIIPHESLFLGRFYGQAPEIDGTVVVHTANKPKGCGKNSHNSPQVLSDRSKTKAGEHDYQPGSFVTCRILRCNGIDLEADIVLNNNMDKNS